MANHPIQIQDHDNVAQPTIVCLMGPTASGKTRLAYELYETGQYEIISVDSALVYQEMNIGTAKPSTDELRQYPHHLVNIISPEQVYSAAQFVEDTHRLIAEIVARGKTPLLVGGTMLYFNSLLIGLAEMPAADATIRAAIVAEAEQGGWESIHAQLSAVDPRAAARFKPSDRQRLLRALEVYRISGRAISDFHAAQAVLRLPYQVQAFALMPERQILHEQIAKRLTLMWQAGFVEEVIALRQRPTLTAEMTSMRAVGYRQVWQYLDQLAAEGLRHDDQVNPRVAMLYADMQDKALFATRQLAKRQCTWIRKLQSQTKICTFDHQNSITTVLNGKV